MAPAKLVSTGTTCVAFLLLGPTLLCPQTLSEVLMYATLTEPVAVSTSGCCDILQSNELFSALICCLDYGFIPSSLTYSTKEKRKV